METFTASPQPAGPSSPAHRRRRWPLVLGVVSATVVGLFGVRFFNENLSVGEINVFERVVQESCDDGFCVQRLHSPDLLAVPGHDVVLAWQRDAPGRMYRSNDPFDPGSQVTITWEDGGVSLSDAGAATVSWDAAELHRLND
ncbi:hypothetical protein [Kineosporia succinea]|uniref:Uncharacterized protein n=1 Tax=Kineosporia succinea TaxID=84632 RepID=A0ABT9P4B4_9ACTN|nr:hypothetical protein [Kineosporia succinea]MDP9827249.1 hypothetical protein [Kineosporia succinea]